MLVDLDYFFAQCEELRNPEIKDKPIVVGVYSGRTNDSGAVSTSNYVARKYGVTSGLPLFLAKKRLEGTDPIFLPVDHGYYEKISKKIMEIIKKFSDAFEQVGIDEAYLDVTDSVKGDNTKTIKIIEKMKNEVKTKTGVSFSVGVGPNKLIAKIASNKQKPDGVTIIRPEEVRDFLNPLPVDEILGVGKKTKAKMNDLGINSIKDLANFNVQALVDNFGRTLGLYFHKAANGIFEEPIQEIKKPESISRMGTLKNDSQDIELILEKTYEMINEIYSELLQNKFNYKQISILIINSDLSSKTRSHSLDKPSKNKDLIYRHVKKLLEKFLLESNNNIRRVGVKVSQLSKEEPEQKQIINFL